jgi:hypothetical protein
VIGLRLDDADLARIRLACWPLQEVGPSTAVLTTPDRQNITVAGRPTHTVPSPRTTAVRSLGLVTASAAQPSGWPASQAAATAVPGQLPEIGACGAVGVARQRRTPGDLVVLCYARS